MVFSLSLTTSFIPLISLFFGIGLSVGAFWVVAPIVAAESLNPSLRGVAIGTYKTFFDIGSILGPIMLSLLTDVSGYTVGFYVASALLAINMLPTIHIRGNVNES
jgi:MFS family permease